MHDMSKAFDSINRATLIKDLEKILQKDELHLINTMLNVELSVKCGLHHSNYFKTDTGAPQGDCASANIFTFYLAKSLHNMKNYEHDYNKVIQKRQKHLEEHNYNKQEQINHININLEYADDISEITSNPEQIIQLKEKLPSQLAKRNLTINTSKTEEHKISRTNCDNSWKSWKLLGSILDTDNDIKRRKILTFDALHKLKYIFENNKISISTKMEAFNIYISSIFLYNCETWTLTHSHENAINSFQRHLLRMYILNVKWPKTITNENVYEQTKTKQWKHTIKTRRLSWFGHVIRLPNETPAKIALSYATQKYKRPQGRPKTTWIEITTKQLKEDLNLSWNQACDLAKDREIWKNMLKKLPYWSSLHYVNSFTNKCLTIIPPWKI